MEVPEIELRNHLSRLTENIRRLEAENETLRRSLAQVDELMLEQTRSQVFQEFLSDMNHDILVPLNSIKSSLHLINNLNDFEQAKQYISVLQLQILHLQKLLEDMMRINRLDMGLTDFRIEQVNLNRLLQDVFLNLSTQIEQKQLSLLQNYTEPIPYILADRLKLSQAIMNIGQNAIQYTPEGHIQISTRHTDQHIIVEISDTGVGIHPDDLPLIFNRFFRGGRAGKTVQGASGLGLAISKRIITYLKGTIRAESVPNQGTNFIITLPHMERHVTRN